MHLRVNPTDAMSIVDVLDVLGVSKTNLSFAQATKLALSALLESARKEGLIPRREGFEYLTMMRPFEEVNLSARAAKLRLTKLNNREPSDGNGVPVPQRDAVAQLPTSEQLRLNELLFKNTQDPDNMDEQELIELSSLLERTSNNEQPIRRLE
ncbi:MAG TPA: hypothetical protein VF077_08970 [Nitrospiraceae bacterium]